MLKDFFYLNLCHIHFYRFCDKCLPGRKSVDTDDIFNSQPLVLAAMMIFNFGLLIVDHILLYIDEMRS